MDESKVNKTRADEEKVKKGRWQERHYKRIK